MSRALSRMPVAKLGGIFIFYFIFCLLIVDPSGLGPLDGKIVVLGAGDERKISSPIFFNKIQNPENWIGDG